MDNLLIQAESARKSRRYKNALKFYNELLDFSPENELALEGAAYCLYNLQRNEDALIMCQKALRINPNLAIPHVILAYLYDDKGDTANSRQEARIALGLEPSSPEVLCCYGLLLLSDGKIEEAIQYLEKAVNVDADMYLAHYNLFVAYQKQRNRKGVATELNILFRLKPNLRNFIGLLASYLVLNRLLFTVLMLLPCLALFVHWWALFLPHIFLILICLFAGSLSAGTKQWKAAGNSFMLAALIASIDMMILAAR